MGYYMKRIVTVLFALLVGCALQTQPPTVTVPDDYLTLQGALDALPSGGTIILRAGTYYGLKSYGYERTASIVIDGNRDITIQGEAGAVITYDPQNPPTFYGELGVTLLISNAGQTTIDGVKFIGTQALGDPLYDLDVCIYQIVNAPFAVRNSEFTECGHAGIKHGNMPGHPLVVIENNRFHDSGFTTRDHAVYAPGGGTYVMQNNQCWNLSGWCVGYGYSYWTEGAIIRGNSCVNVLGCIYTQYGTGAIVENNFSMNSGWGLGIYGGGATFRNNTFLNSTIDDVYSERACGGAVTNWCANPVPNDFYGNGNLYETISHPDRIQ